MAVRPGRVETVVPAAARTILSLRDIGYELPQAIADLVDNSVSASASEVRIDLTFSGMNSWIRIADNGAGMSPTTITESLRYGSVRDYQTDDLGKFGFGLKTASTSQCRRVWVASRKAPKARIEVRVLDLQHIEDTNRWEILVVAPSDAPKHLTELLSESSSTGTVVVWEDLDRVLDYKDPWGGWARRKLLDQTEAVAEHLGMVFHRFLAGLVTDDPLEMWVNGSPIEPWDPFCLAEKETTVLSQHDFRVASDRGVGIVRVSPFVLPEKADFSSVAAWQRASGILKWNRQQGLYIYRANRLIQWGGWSRLRTIDEHTKLARVAVDFTPTLDSAFGINISKAIVKLPIDLREDLEPVVSQVARLAAQRYRREGKPAPKTRPVGGAPAGRPTATPPPTPAGDGRHGRPPVTGDDEPTRFGVSGETNVIGYSAALEAAAEKRGELVALVRIVEQLRSDNAEVARELGW